MTSGRLAYTQSLVNFRATWQPA